MSTTQFNTANTEGINFGETWTVYDQTAASSSTNSPDNPGPRVAVGTTVKGTGDTDFVCVKASAAIAAGDTCLISTTFTAAGITTTNATGATGALVGVSVVAIASGAYGWLQRAGLCTPTGVTVITATAPYFQLSTTATAGVLDDAITTLLVRVNGVVVTATNNSGANAGAVAMLNYPVVGTAY